MLDKPIKIEHYEERFGFLAIEKGFITQDELSKAQAVHAQEEIKNGIYRHLGEILFFQGIMSAQQIEEVVNVVVGHPLAWN